MIKIALSQYRLEILSNWIAYVSKITSIVEEVIAHGAQLLVLPECAGLEIVCARFDSDYDLLKAAQADLPRYLTFFSELATRHQLYIQAGTILVEVAPHRYANRAYFFAPSGQYGYQDKLNLIEYEKQIEIVVPGSEQTVFDTALGKIGIATCYDSEFPENVRNLIKTGAELILVPSYTASKAGFYRVFISARARAIENQCYVATSCIVGPVTISGSTDQCYGQAALLGPADIGFPDEGVLAIGQLNQEMLIIGEIDLEKLYAVRKQGQVRNYHDARKHIERAHRVKLLKL